MRRVASLFRWPRCSGFVSLGAALALSFGLPSQADACECKPSKDAWNKKVVFVGKALEDYQRVPNRETVHIVDVAVRYQVEASNRLAPGIEVLVFSDLSGCGGGYHEVGRRGIVVVNEVDGVLVTSDCLRLRRDERAEVLRNLKLPSDFQQTYFYERVEEDCERPKTVAEAFQGADAVGHTIPHRACWNAETGKTERLAYARRAWKGLPLDQWFVVTRSNRKRHVSTPEESLVFDRMDRGWPPAEFLRETGPLRFEESACLEPNVPVGDAAIEAAGVEVERLTPMTKGEDRFGREPKAQLPSLACSKITEADIEAANARLTRWQENAMKEHRSGSPSRGGFASCSTTPASLRSETPVLVYSLALLATVARRRTRRVARLPGRGA